MTSERAAHRDAAAGRPVGPITFSPASRVGVVVIGRNEGPRLGDCLSSLSRTSVAGVVYVDSASTDGSAELAEAFGVAVHRLDARLPLSAARARNAGFETLTRRLSTLEYVQFVDGDCEIDAAWLDRAERALDESPRTAAVCGRRREKYPGRSVYNLLCDFEWNTPVGEALAFGGDVMLRAPVFAQAGGYREDLIAGEDPELGVRLRQAGWRIVRLDAAMTLHDAGMTRFSQWWRRTMRAGYAYAEGSALHGAPPERHWVKETRRAWIWGAAIPLAIAAAALLVNGWLLAGLLIYPVQCLRIFTKVRGSVSERASQAVFLTLGKFAEAVGQMKFTARRRLGARSTLIEYK
jgi:GT2 family glycosyltransferase